MLQRYNYQTGETEITLEPKDVRFDPSFNPARTPDQVRAQDNASNAASAIQNRVNRPTNLLTGGTNQPGDATRQATPAMPQTTLATRFGGLDRANNADQASRGLIAQPAQPARPTAENPLVIREAKKPSFDAVDFSGLDAMSPQDIRRFVTQLQAKASRGQEITYEEQVLLVEANNKIQDVRAQQVANPYNEQIAAEQQARDIEAARLRAQSETLMTAEEQRLNSIYQQRSQQATEQGARASQAGARSMSFSGLGRSTFNADQQVRIQEQTNQNLSILDEAKNLDIELYRAKLAGLDGKALESYQIRINTLLTDSAKFIAEQAVEINSFNEKNNASYQESIQNILEYAQNYVDPNEPVTEEDKLLIAAYAQTAIDSKGDIDVKKLEGLNPRLRNQAIIAAAALKGAILTEQYKFLDAGNGLVARTNDKTGDIERFQGDVKLSPLDQAKINEMNANTNKTKAETDGINDGSGGSSNGTTANNPQSTANNAQSIVDFSVNKRGKETLQCGELVNDYLLKTTGKDPTGLSRFTNTLDEKMSALKSLGISNGPTQGGIFVSNPLGNKVGHTGIVQTVNEDGSFTVLEANASGSKAGEAPRLKTYSSSAGMSFSNAPVAKLSGMAKMVQDGTMKMDNVPSEMREQVANEIANSTPVADTVRVDKIKSEYDSIKSIIDNGDYKFVSGNIQSKGINNLLGFKTSETVSLLTKILDSNTLQTLIDAKSNGATFGALSNEELRLLQSTASDILGAAIRGDDGSIKGFNLSESVMKARLKTLLDGYEKEYNKASEGGTLVGANTPAPASTPVADIANPNAPVADKEIMDYLSKKGL